MNTALPAARPPARIGIIRGMANHPNRSRSKGPASSPTPEQIRETRMKAELSQSQAAALIDGTMRAWQGYECDEGAPDHRRMHAGLWRLFRARLAWAKGDMKALEKLLGAPPSRELP